MIASLRNLAGLALLFPSASGHAAPSRVDPDLFSEMLDGAVDIVIEAFDYCAHEGANPYNIVNGTLETSSSVRGGEFPLIGIAFCPGQDSALESLSLKPTDPGSTIVFRAFPEGTTLWAARLCFQNPADVLDISVTGISGTLKLSVAAESLASGLAFEDMAGLTSVSITNRGGDGVPASGYYFDEITTARTQ